MQRHRPHLASTSIRFPRLPAGSILPFGRGVAVTHPSAGVLLVDLRLPELPDELTRLPMPGEPAALAAQGDQLWVGTHQGGLALVHRQPPAAPPIRPRSWLPWLGGG